MGRRSARLDEGLLVVEGAMLLREAASAGWRVVAQVLAPEGEALPSIGEDLWFLAPDVLEKISDTTTPQPVLGLVERRVMDLKRVAVSGWVLVLDRIADPGNAGTLIRSAEAAGAGAVFITKGSVDWSSPKTVRSSAGAVFNVPIVEVSDLDAVKSCGWKLVGTSSHEKKGAKNYKDADMTGPVALVLGNEAHGLDTQVAFDQWVFIPHLGRAESLNVAMAGTLLAFEIAGRKLAESE